MVEPYTTYTHRTKGGSVTVTDIATLALDAVARPEAQFVVFQDDHGAPDNCFVTPLIEFEANYVEVTE